MQKWLPLMLAATLAGCLSNPAFERLQLPLPDVWHAPLPSSAEHAELRASDDWWAGFGDPELQRLLQQALQNNPDLRIAVDHMLAAGAGIRVVRAAEFPSLSFNAGPTDPVILQLAGQNPHSHADDSHYEVGLNATYEIDFWGRVSNSLKAAHAEFVASAYDVDTARIALLSDVARAYFDLREADEMLGLAIEKAGLADQRAQLLTLQLQAGRISAASVADAQLAAQEPKAAIADLQGQRALALLQLQALLGDSAESLQIASSTLSADLKAPVPAPGLPSSLLERRADIRAAESHLMAAEAQVAVARAERFPQVQLTGELGFLSAAVVHILGAGSALVGIGPGIALPIFDGGRGAAEFELREHQYDAALAEYQKTVIGAFGDVEKALLGYQAAVEAKARWSSADALIAAQIQRLQLSLAAGHASRLQLIALQQQAIEIQLSSLLAQRQHLDSMVLLYQALGGASPTVGDEATAKAATDTSTDTGSGESSTR
jgi:multidrug efflux system outer membrane protein